MIVLRNLVTKFSTHGELDGIHQPVQCRESVPEQSERTIDWTKP